MDEIQTDQEREIVVKAYKRPLILSCSLITLIIIIITGLVVYFFTSEYVSKIVLWSLFSILISIGLCMIFYVEYQKCLANKRKQQTFRRRPRRSNNKGWIRSVSTLEARYIQPSPEPPKLSVSMGWALNPRKWSVATTSVVANSPQPNGTVI